MDFRLAGGEIESQIEGLQKVLTGLLRNTPGGMMRIPFEDLQKFPNEQIHIEVIQSPLGSYVDVALIRQGSNGD